MKQNSEENKGEKVFWNKLFEMYDWKLQDKYLPEIGILLIKTRL